MGKRRVPPGHCFSCGRRCTKEAVDNHGTPYIGCAFCRILSLEEIAKIEAAGRSSGQGSE